VNGGSDEQRRWRYVYYKTVSGRVPVREFIEAQPDRVRAKIFEDLERFVKVNVMLSHPYIEEVTGQDFWELRTRVAGDIYRTFYFAHAGRKFVLLHAFQKKSRKAPKKELNVAEERMTDYLRRVGKLDKRN
jgi:phage-related protein